MPVRDYVEIVNPNTCLGDSLVTFNANFSGLNDKLVKQPTLVGGVGTAVKTNYTEQGYNIEEVSVKSAFTYGKEFDSTIDAQSGNIFLQDGTSIPVVTFQYSESPLISNSYNLATFTAISLTDSPPVVTIYWTASGSDLSTTVYATNSATSATNTTEFGSLGLNGSVTALLKSGDSVYVGGEFTSIGTINCKKLCILNLNGGKTIGVQGAVGTLVGTSLSSEGGFGDTGTINAIAEYGNLLIFGGSYQSIKMGRALTIYNKSTNIIYPFYVNGEVNTLAIRSGYLYVGGTFDYINYTAQSASVISGLRNNTNGLVKINLETIESFPNSAIDKNFSNSVQTQFNNTATINSIAVSNSLIIYIGGKFDAQLNSEVIASNLAILNPAGSINENWKPIVGGTVYKLAVDGNYLYVGGEFKYISSFNEFFGNPRVIQTFYNIASFDITVSPSPILQTVWKPNFNGKVTNLCFHDGEYGSYVYCCGEFTVINGHSANYLACVNKSFSNMYSGQDYVPWRVNLDKTLTSANQTLIRLTDSLIVGGSFDHVNGVQRKKLTRINGVNEEYNNGEELKTTSWNLGAQLCNPGTNLSLQLTDFVTTVTPAARYGVVNQTTFPVSYTTRIFKNYSKGSLLRFFIQRPNSSGNLTSDVHVIGWKVDFN